MEWRPPGQQREAMDSAKVGSDVNSKCVALVAPVRLLTDVSISETITFGKASAVSVKGPKILSGPPSSPSVCLRMDYEWPFSNRSSQHTHVT